MTMRVRRHRKARNPIRLAWVLLREFSHTLLLKASREGKRLYALEGRFPVPCKLSEAGTFFGRSVRQSSIGGTRVSTVFLGLDHNFRGGAPLLFETMTFSDTGNMVQMRYPTWEAAETGHALICYEVRHQPKGSNND